MNPEIKMKAYNHYNQTMPAPSPEDFRRNQGFRRTDIASIMDETDPLNLLGKRGFFARLKAKFNK